MSHLFASLLACFTAALVPVGTECHYTGSLSQQTTSGMTEVKSFSLYTVSLMTEDGASRLAFHVEERGSGTWGWPERFGEISLATSAASKSRAIRILYTRDGQQYPLTLRSPAFEFYDKLAIQTSWKDGRYEYQVTGKRKVNDRNCFEVQVSTNLGRMQTLLVDADTTVIVSSEEKVTIGRGEAYELKMDLESQTLLTAADLAKNQAIVNSLLALQASLNRTGDQTAVELTTDQLNSVRKELPRLEKEAQETSWSRFVAAIARDTQQQQKRVDGIAGLQKKRVGQPQPSWRLKLIDGGSVSDEELKGKVVVMHFWQYRGEPLNEPYGQIGYLDFLNSKRKKLGVAVIGVNVDERFANPKETAAANRSMKALLEFMKISYDMATDDGSVLAEFGDPRSAGAPLPLWIVIGHDGVVTHFHSGFYNIKPDEGLKTLDNAVVEALRRQKGSKE